MQTIDPMKTVLEHLNDLPSDVKDIALENYRRQNKQLPAEPNSIMDALVLAFNWNKSPEGRIFWDHVYFRLKAEAEEAKKPKVKTRRQPVKKVKIEPVTMVKKEKEPKIRKPTIKYEEYLSMDCALESVLESEHRKEIK